MKKGIIIIISALLLASLVFYITVLLQKKFTPKVEKYVPEELNQTPQKPIEAGMDKG